MTSKKLFLVAGAIAVTLGGAVATASVASGTEAAPKAPAVSTPAWAKIAANGTFLGGSGITGVNKFGQGRYNLTTAQNIANCALNGTINTNGGGDPGPGSSSILVGAVNGNTLFVRTATPSSTSPATVDDDRPFSVTITCN